MTEFKSKKILSIIIAAVMAISCSIISAGAVDENSSQQEKGASSSKTVLSVTDKEADTNTSSQNEEKSKGKEYSFSENTIGNSELIANEEVLMENGYYQFIAVTTRDEDVFYIIIDKTKQEDNVYFLNQVDTYDINKLLNKDNENGGASAGSLVAEDTTIPTEAVTEGSTSSGNNSQFMFLVIIGVISIVVIAVVIMRMRKKKNPAKSVQEDDEDYYYDTNDEEINEDEE